ncbi:MAG: hypothetical protein IKO45_03100 [Clostridia bacterium]|nr:hypothetical protein [Clostridia bacterium]
MKICKFCNTQCQDSCSICPSCGGNEFKNICKNCGTIFEEGNYCPRCGIKIGQEPKKCPNCGQEYYSNACPNCGYSQNLSNNQYNYVYTPINSVPSQPVHKRRTWLWVLGWVFIFPIPLTILLLRNKTLKPFLKYSLIAVSWIIYLAIGFSNRGTNDRRDKSKDQSSLSSIIVSSEKSDVSEKEDTSESISSNVSSQPISSVVTNNNIIDDFVAEYNSKAEDILVFVEDFVVSDKNSGHYRTEFRLGAFKKAIGKSYKVGDQIVDIIAWYSITKKVSMRIYTDHASLDFCINVVKYASPILDKEMTQDTVNRTIEYLIENQEANGYYYGNLGLVLLGKYTEHGYELMIKTD